MKSNKPRALYSILSWISTCIFIYVIVHTGKLWTTVLHFITSECIKLLVIQKLFKLDPTTINQKRKRYPNKIRNIIMESIKFASLIIFSSFIFGVVCVLLGAPAISQYEETFALSSLLTILTLFPISLFLGVNNTLSLIMTDQLQLVNYDSGKYLELLKRNAYFVLIGAFCGSVVAPLDWDRQWQVYPIPNIVGAVTGHFLACCYCCFETMVSYEYKKKE